MIRRLATLTFVFAAQIAATAPPRIIAGHLTTEGSIDLVDLSWLKGALPDASAAEKGDWAPVLPWLRECSADGAARVKADLLALGIASPLSAPGANGNELCAAVLRMSRVARRFPDWSTLKVAAADADTRFVLFTYAAGLGAESVPFDPQWVNPDALQLLRATVREQFLRRALSWRQTGDGPPISDDVWRVLEARLLIAVTAEDHKNTAMMKAFVDAKGWPTTSMVGPQASGSAWLLVQHADDDPAFQFRMLRLMEPLSANGEVTKGDYALLYDRVMLKLVGKQRYATQATCEGGKRVPLPVEDNARIDEFRTMVGLGTLAENMARLDKLYGPCPPEDASAAAPAKR